MVGARHRPVNETCFQRCLDRKDVLPAILRLREHLTRDGGRYKKHPLGDGGRAKEFRRRSCGRSFVPTSVGGGLCGQKYPWHSRIDGMFWADCQNIGNRLRLTARLSALNIQRAGRLKSRSPSRCATPPRPMAERFRASLSVPPPRPARPSETTMTDAPRAPASCRRAGSCCAPAPRRRPCPSDSG